jgi:hypothetical protein
MLSGRFALITEFDISTMEDREIVAQLYVEECSRFDFCEENNAY